MDVKCCECKKEYDLGDNIFGYDKANCPILICPHCGFKHLINFMPFEKRIKVKKIEKLDLAVLYVNLGATRIANATRVDQSKVDDGDIMSWRDVYTAIYDEKSKYVGDKDTSPRGIAFSTDGTKMYIMGAYHDTIRQYTLSTPWDVSTATYDFGKNVEVQDALPGDMAFNPDGTKMYMAGGTYEKVYQYTLSTPWNITTATYDEKSVYVGNEDTLLKGIAFSPDGTKMYMVGSDYDTVFQYNLSTGWDISTATYANKSKDISAQDDIPEDVAFNTDGTKMYLAGSTDDMIYQYTLSTPWDVSTATYDNISKNVSNQDVFPRGCTFNPEGSKMYVLGMSNNTVFQYSLSTNWTKTNDFILATRIYTSKGPIARAYKLRWRDVTDEGVFADVSNTGEITYSAITDLTDDDDLLVGEKICDVQTDYTWQNGLESEGDNILPDSGTYSLADEYYTEFQWALDCSNAEDEHEYEFELYDVTEGASVGTCLASITMAVPGPVPLASTANMVTSTVSVLSRGVTEALASTSAITSSITGRLTRIVDLVSTSAIVISITSLLSKGVALVSTSNIVTSITGSLSRGVGEALTSTSDIATSILGRLSRIRVLLSTSDMVSSTTGSLSRGIKGVLVSTSSIATSITSVLTRGITQTLTSTVNGVVSFTGNLSRGVKELLTSTANIAVSIIASLTKVVGETWQLISTAVITSSITSSLSRGIKEVLASTAVVVTSLISSISRGITETLNTTTNITISFTSNLSRGVTEALTSTVNIVSSFTSRITKVINLISTSAIATSIVAGISRGITETLNSTTVITTSVTSTLSRGVKEVLVSATDIVVSIISRLSTFIKFLRATLSINVNDSILSSNASCSTLLIGVNGSVLSVYCNESNLSIYSNGSDLSIYSNESILSIEE